MDKSAHQCIIRNDHVRNIAARGKRATVAALQSYAISDMDCHARGNIEIIDNSVILPHRNAQIGKIARIDSAALLGFAPRYPSARTGGILNPDNGAKTVGTRRFWLMQGADGRGGRCWCRRQGGGGNG
jgi:hypothetical protein